MRNHDVHRSSQVRSRGVGAPHVAVAAVLAAAVLALSPSSARAQAASAPPATIMDWAAISAALDKFGPAATAATGAAVTVSPGISVRRRAAGGEPQYAIIHPLSIEIYQIIDGGGTLVTGGVLDPPVAPENPDLIRTKSIKGGVTRKVAKGDVIVMPPGTPHWFSAVDGSITYLEARIRVPNPSGTPAAGGAASSAPATAGAPR